MHSKLQLIWQCCIVAQLPKQALTHKDSHISLYSSFLHIISLPNTYYACTLWGNNNYYNARLSQIVKLENKAVCVINAFWNFLTKLNTSMLFQDYFHHENFSTIQVSVVSELMYIITIHTVHHPIKLSYPLFELIDFAIAMLV